MTVFGYTLNCEEHGPDELIRQAQLAEDSGFDALWISDHFHPWLPEQGEAPFVWSVIGALSQVVSIPVTTAVTCPTVRYHPAIVAQAAATSQVMTGGTFRLGVGTGEALNEHITGEHWPSAAERLEMLEEAVEIIRALHGGRQISHRGRHFTVETARLYTVPDDPPPILMSAYGPKAISMAARLADGLMSTFPDAEAVQLFRDEGGEGKIVAGGFKACYGPDEDECAATAHRLWRNEQVPGEASQVLTQPRHFKQVSEMVTVDRVKQKVPCGPDLDRHIAAVEEFTNAGFEEVYMSQIGPDQDAFFKFYGAEVLPRLRA
ncbi:F420-dependent glucose-6-phosphate dehydrogenase [Actinomadura rubteroloni]|uniref:F420-dependent glucose-6-phosphate dehydrogenase n=1 Tax=Actinomadura rubteroloni TaxID=1926885 RepID=A0A2P4UP87_9ACTN|nr:TIGR03557 family F420-dependent LLM class oxidoreductase [Actinomadura rubteroloni]POM26870.1 F420-dependent glucose-6-phosphate dehydrogenase [Actinomadura rubteroloni]